MTIQFQAYNMTPTSLKIQRLCCKTNLSKGARSHIPNLKFLNYKTLKSGTIYLIGLLQGLENKKAHEVPDRISIITFVTKCHCLETKMFRLTSSHHLALIWFHRPFFHIPWDNKENILNFSKLFFLTNPELLLRLFLFVKYHLTHFHLSKS